MTRGERLRHLAKCFFDARTMERIVDPAIADFQREPASASGAFAVLKVLVICALEGARVERDAWTRAATVAAAVTMLGVGMLEIPYLSYARRFGAEIGPFTPIYLAPQAFPIAVAVGMLVGAVLAFDGRQPAGRMGRRLLLVAGGVSLTSLVDVTWVVPSANQAFRVLVTGNPAIARGLAEMSLGELRRFSSPDVVFAFQTRVALAFMPLALALFAVAIAPAKSVWRWTAAIMSIVVFVAYYMVLYGGRRVVLDGTVPAFLAAWTPNLAVVLAAAAALGARRIRATA